MVRLIAVALVLLVGAGLCFALGGFCGWQWLWCLPLCVVGGAVGLIILYFLILWISCLFVDVEKPQKKDSKYFRFLTYTTAQLAIWLVRAKIHTKGLEQTPKEGRFLLVCNHLHEIDPAVLLTNFKKNQLAFIAKQETKKMFLVGKVLHKLMCQLINRENDREALKTIITCIRMIQEDQVSVAVFPEGYIKGDNLLHPFRSGVFKIAQKTKVPIVVCTMQNTQNVLKNFLKLKPTDVHLHLVGVVQPEEFASMTTVDIANRVHAMMAEDLGPDKVFRETP